MLANAGIKIFRSNVSNKDVHCSDVQVRNKEDVRIAAVLTNAGIKIYFVPMLVTTMYIAAMFKFLTKKMYVLRQC